MKGGKDGPGLKWRTTDLPAVEALITPSRKVWKKSGIHSPVVVFMYHMQPAPS